MLKPLILALTFTFTTQAVAENKPQSLLDTYNQALGNDPTLASALSANKAAQEIIKQAKPCTGQW